MSTCATCKHFHTRQVSPEQLVTVCRRYPPTTHFVLYPEPTQQQAANDAPAPQRFAFQQVTTYPAQNGAETCGEYTVPIQLSSSMPSGSIRQ